MTQQAKLSIFLRSGSPAQPLLNEPGVNLRGWESMMVKMSLLGVALVLGWVTVGQAQVWVEPYMRKDGTYVAGRYRSNPNGNVFNDWSPGNVSSFTSQQGIGDSNKYLERHNNQGTSGSPSYGNGPRYNPYSIYLR
jgi:hypothetical protein